MQRDLSDSGDSNRILRHESELHFTSLASEFQFGETFGINFEVQHNVLAIEALIRCFVSKSFSRSII